LSNLKDIAIVILAAGKSSRLGRPKQLVNFRGKSLLQHAIDVVKDFDFAEKIVVLGANAEKIQQEIDLSGFDLVKNEHWSEGISSSIKMGLEAALSRKADTENIVFLLCDQPFLAKANLEKLIENQLQNAPMATFSKYGKNIGVPAIFAKESFSLLRNLKGDEGAKKLTFLPDFKYETVNFEKGDFDVDTEEDVEKLKELE
tara:strand:- start:5536 stop:6138 length:603 start_codon:yes stop_codon:yes gene_type:complete